MRTARSHWLFALVLAGCARSYTHVADGGASAERPEDGAVAEVDAGIPDDVLFARLLIQLHRARCAHAIRCEVIEAAQGSCHPAADGRADFPFSVLNRRCDGQVFNVDAAARCLESVREDGCFINGSDDWLACHDVWGAPPPAGSSCRPWSCGRDGYCDTPWTGPWHCVERGEVDAACRRGGPRMRGGSIDCAEGLDCVRDPAGVTSSCQLRTRPGDPCDPTRYEPACSFGQYCSGGVCQGYALDVGDRCESEGCMGELHCVGNSELATCQRGALEDEACTTDRYCWLESGCAVPPCAAGLRCVAERCVAIRAPGEVCSRSDECPYAFHCESGTCAADPVEGEPCPDGAPCARGACRDGVCTLLGEGEPCDWRNGDFSDGLGTCAVGVCWDSICPTIVPIGDPCPTDATSFTHTCELGAHCDYSTRLCAPAQSTCGFD